MAPKVEKALMIFLKGDEEVVIGLAAEAEGYKVKMVIVGEDCALPSTVAHDQTSNYGNNRKLTLPNS